MGDVIRVKGRDRVYEGFLMPRFGIEESDHIVLKISTGYNIGVRFTKGVQISRVRSGRKPEFVRPALPKGKKGLPRVSIVSTGGTIASRVDYKTGGVHAALSAQDLYTIVPELADMANVETEVLLNIYSEDMSPRYWTKIAKGVAKHLKRGVDGVVVPHGTDTMHYTGAALSFALQNLPVPVILVGAQRSSDRPSSDAALNLIGAVSVASKGPFSEVAVAMHSGTSDKRVVIHRSTRIRKFHTSRRDAFKSINAPALAHYQDGKIEMLTRDYLRRDKSRKVQLKAKFDEKVALVKFHPGMDPHQIDWYVDQGYHGIVLEGTGLGHVSHQCLSSIKRATGNGIVVGMTSQCIYGRVNLNVYETGRALLALGVIPLEDMLAETAYVKLSWCFGVTREAEEVKKLMLTNIVHEISSRTQSR